MRSVCKVDEALQRGGDHHLRGVKAEAVVSADAVSNEHHLRDWTSIEKVGGGQVHCQVVPVPAGNLRQN